MKKIILISIMLFFLGTMGVRAQNITGYQSKSITIYDDTLFATGIAGRADSVAKDTSTFFNFSNRIGNYTLSCYFDTVLAGGVFPDVVKISFQLADSMNTGNTPSNYDSIAYWGHNVSQNDSIFSFPVDTMGVWYYKDDVSIPVCRYGRFIFTVDTAFAGSSKYYFFAKLRFQ